ncbi:MAG: aminotransferase class V-fold PLP-dependent enzyme [Bacillota bacterium]|nr:aminotransferase class V-fold PLP-dependent enzyme [Bacillota bacterium]
MSREIRRDGMLAEGQSPEMPKDRMVVEGQIPEKARAGYLNTGTNGLLPQVAAEAVADGVRRELEQGRRYPWHSEWGEQVLGELRQELAGFFGVGFHQVALTYSTSDAMNVALAAMRWQPGDEVVTTNLEHPGLLLPLYLLRRRYGVVLRVVDLGWGHGTPGELAERLGRAVGPRTRLVALSHVAFGTGAVLPLAEITRLAHDRGIPVLVDGAQSAGAIPVDVGALGVDFYAVPGQKWLCGPVGTGALLVRDEILGALELPAIGYAGTERWETTGYFVPVPGARRFEVAGRFIPAYAGWLASLRWLGSLGWAEIHTRTAYLATRAQALLGGLPGVKLVTPSPEPGLEPAGLVSFQAEGYTPQRVQEECARAGLQLRTIPEPPCCRISTAFYVAERELEALADLLSRLPSH